MTDFFKNKKITVTGGAGFLGFYIVRDLEKLGCSNIFIPIERDYDLTRESDVIKMYKDSSPDIVIHLAAKVGGIGANKENPAKYFYDNLIMGAQLLHHGYLNKIEKFVGIGTICSYPKFTKVPFKEDDLWNGYPEETNAPYGIAKKMMLVQSDAYRQQYGFNSIFLLPVNLYGPRDKFDLKESHVIPALIRKCIEAIELGEKEIEVWGDGSPTREFCYVEEMAQAILLATEKYNKAHPVNIGAGFEISIKDLSSLIASLTGFKGIIKWDTKKPNGQPRRMLDTSRAQKEFGFKAKTSLEDGLIKTIEWYRGNRNVIKS